ncbi:MAG: 30S ribosomal protein S18 [Chloroflexi bacterium]|nr:30S ribosomal protein S18 [Chloroflexota bacterium]
MAETEQPGTGAPAEQPSAAAEQSATAAAAPVGRPPAPPGRSAGPAPRSERRSSGPPDRGGGRFFGRRKVCTFCVDKAKSVDYKDPSKLRRFVSDRGRIEGRRRTGVCAKHQRWLAVALKRARHLALLPYTPEHIRSSGAFPSRR